MKQPSIERAESVARTELSFPSKGTSNISGSCSDWLVGAGIAETPSVDALIASESGCDPRSLNASSGACGIMQNINGCDTYDPIQQLKEMNSYIIARYGSWDSAWAFHLLNNWY